MLAIGTAIDPADKGDTRMIRAALLAAALLVTSLAAPSTAHAAKVEKRNFTDSGKPYISITGDFEKGDADVFKAILDTFARGDRLVVVLNDNHGGLLAEGLRIGAMIHDARGETVTKTFCYSACAIAWLGGTAQFIYGDAQVGFHAAYDDKRVVSAPAASVMGYYVAQLGLGADMAAWVTGAGPDDVNVMTKKTADEFHLHTTFIEQPQPPGPEVPKITPEQQRRIDAIQPAPGWKS